MTAAASLNFNQFLLDRFEELKDDAFRFTKSDLEALEAPSMNARLFALANAARQFAHAPVSSFHVRLFRGAVRAIVRGARRPSGCLLHDLHNKPPRLLTKRARRTARRRESKRVHMLTAAVL